MTFSKLMTGTSGNAGQYSARGRKIRGWIIHHAASTSLSGVLSMMRTGSRQVSSNYVIDGQQIIGVVPEEYRAWTSASSIGDGENLTVEIVNDRVGSTDMTWTISEASYESIARLIAETSARYGFSIDRNNIIGHREVIGRYGQGYSTACPSGVDLDRIVALANRDRDQGTEPDTPAFNLGGTMDLIQDRDGRIFVIGPNLFRHVTSMDGVKGIQASIRKLGGDPAPQSVGPVRAKAMEAALTGTNVYFKD